MPKIAETLYKNFLLVDIYAGDDLNTPLYSSYRQGYDFPYTGKVENGKPILYLPKGGKAVLRLNEAAITSGFTDLGQVPTFQDSIYRYEDYLHLDGVGQIYYHHPSSGAVSVASQFVNGYTIADDGAYGTTRQLKFTEYNRYGSEFPFYLTVNYRFCDVYPGLEVSAGTVRDAGPDAGSLADAGNTIWSKYTPNARLDYLCNNPGGYAMSQILDPYEGNGRKASYSLERRRDGAWETVTAQTKGNSEVWHTPAAGNWRVDPVVSAGNIVAYASQDYDEQLFAKYRLHVESRNIVGNLSKKDFYFYLDVGVAALPQIVWSYAIPTMAIAEDQRVEGKETAAEFDFGSLGKGEHEIVRVRLFDANGFLTKEGFQGMPEGANYNVSGVFLLRDPNKPIDEYTKTENLIAPVQGGYGTDAGYDARQYLSFALTQQDFLNQAQYVEDRELKKVPHTVYRVIQDENGGRLEEREVQVPTNTWNRAFRVKVLFRDWIGNENVVDAVVAPEYPEFALALSNNGISTPAFCPDIQMTSVYIAGENDIVAQHPELALDPQPGMPLDVTLMPTLRAFASKYKLRVTDVGGAQVFPGVGEDDEFECMGAAARLTTLRYGDSYRFYVTAVNDNGYKTEPESMFAFLMNRDELVVNRSGQLGADEVWNWKYRLMGDVIVPSSVKLLVVPGAGVVAPRMPAVYADRRTKIIVKTGGTLIVDGGYLNGDGSFNAASKYLDGKAFVNLLPSGMDTRLAAGGSAETVYAFDGENNWGGIYFENGYDRASYIRRARICGAYDGVLLLGAGNETGQALEISDCLVLSNYIGLDVNGSAKLLVDGTVIDSNLEYGIKTDGTQYAVKLENVAKVGPGNKYADYYSAKSRRRLSFEGIKNNPTLKGVEEGGL